MKECQAFCGGLKSGGELNNEGCNGRGARQRRRVKGTCDIILHQFLNSDDMRKLSLTDLRKDTIYLRLERANNARHTSELAFFLVGDCSRCRKGRGGRKKADGDNPDEVGGELREEHCAWKGL